MPQPTPTQGNSPRNQRLEAYVEEDLYEWVHRQAASQERTASSWLRYVLLRVREGLQDGADPATLGGGIRDQT